MRKYKINYPVLIDEKGSAGGQYGLSRYPHILIVDKSGRLSYYKSGYQGDSSNVELEKEISEGALRH